MTIEIPQKDWKPFCEKLTSQKDSLVDIRVQNGGDMQLIAQGVPLHSFSFDDTSDGCNNTLTIKFGQGHEKTGQQEVVEPIRLILRRESKGDHYNLLEMPAESGTTVVVFHPGIKPELLGV